MDFYSLKPEVPGHFGKQAIFDDRFARPPQVIKLHYEFDGWLGDDLVTVILTYAGTARLAGKLQNLVPAVTGLSFDMMTVTKSDEYREWGDLQPQLLPDFVWFKIDGQPGVDDFGLADSRLIVSERILRVLQSLNLNHCEIGEYKTASR